MNSPHLQSFKAYIPRVKQIFKDLWGGKKKTAGAAGGLFLFNRSWEEIWLILRCRCGCPNVHLVMRLLMAIRSSDIAVAGLNTSFVLQKRTDQFRNRYSIFFKQKMPPVK